MSMSYFLSTVMLILWTASTISASLIVPLQYPPQKLLKVDSEKALKRSSKKLASLQGHELAKTLYKKGLYEGNIVTLSGFPALYAGYLDYSNEDGVVQFPLSHTSHRVFIAISESIDLDRLKNNTLTGLLFPNNNNEKEGKAGAEYYLLERKQLENGTLFWHSKKIDIPNDRRLKKISLIFLTNPNNLVIPTGDFFIDPAKKNLYELPPIYVVGNHNQAKILANNLFIFPFFEPIERTMIETPGIVHQSLIKNR